MGDLYQTTSARNHEQRQAWALLIQAGVLRPVERCKHGKGHYDGHWVTGPCFCGQRHPITKELGQFGPTSLQDEYSEAVWTPCTHEWCPGAVIGGTVTHEEWCNIYKTIGGCSCTGIGGSDDGFDRFAAHNEIGGSDECPVERDHECRQPCF